MTATRERAPTTVALPDLEVRLVRTDDEFAGVLDIRRRVFVEEQGLVASGVTDRDDARGVHVVAALAGTIVGCARLTPNLSQPRNAQITWVATLPEYRGRGVGTAVMRRLLAAADEAGLQIVTLSAQTHALAFYRRLGFAPYGQRFVVWGVEHQMMARSRPQPDDGLSSPSA